MENWTVILIFTSVFVNKLLHLSCSLVLNLVCPSKKIQSNRNRSTMENSTKHRGIIGTKEKTLLIGSKELTKQRIVVIDQFIQEPCSCLFSVSFCADYLETVKFRTVSTSEDITGFPNCRQILL